MESIIIIIIIYHHISSLFRSTLSLNQGSSSCRRPPNLISRLIGEEGGAIKFGKKLIHDWRRRWQTNPILKISDWIGLPASARADCIGASASSRWSISKLAGSGWSSNGAHGGLPASARADCVGAPASSRWSISKTS